MRERRRRREGGRGPTLRGTYLWLCARSRASIFKNTPHASLFLSLFSSSRSFLFLFSPFSFLLSPVIGFVFSCVSRALGEKYGATLPVAGRSSMARFHHEIEMMQLSKKPPFFLTLEKKNIPLDAVIERVLDTKLSFSSLGIFLFLLPSFLLHPPLCFTRSRAGPPPLFPSDVLRSFYRRRTTS